MAQSNFIRLNICSVSQYFYTRIGGIAKRAAIKGIDSVGGGNGADPNGAKLSLFSSRKI
jgi:hypothetical protein